MSMVGVNAFAHDIVVDGIYYNLNNEKMTAEVTFMGDYYDSHVYSGDVAIPESINYSDQTYSVTSIGRSAFCNCTDLTSITIPESVATIGGHAFESCSGLTSITIPKSVTSIGISAFRNCYGLTKVIVPDIAAWCVISFGHNTTTDDTSNPLYYAKHLYSDENTVTMFAVGNANEPIGNGP